MRTNRHVDARTLALTIAGVRQTVLTTEYLLKKWEQERGWQGRGVERITRQLA